MLSAGSFQAFRRNISTRPSGATEAMSRSPVLGPSPPGLVFRPPAARCRLWWPTWPPGRWLLDPCGLGLGRVQGRGRSGPSGPRPSHAAAWAGALTRAGAASAMATASSLGCGPPPTDLARRRLIFSQQVRPRAGCALVRSRSRSTSELLSCGRKLHTVPGHVPCCPLHRGAAEAAAGRAQRPLEPEGPHSAAANPWHQPCHGAAGGRQLASGKPTGG